MYNPLIFRRTGRQDARGAPRDTIEAMIWTLATSFLSPRRFVSARPLMGGCRTLIGAPRRAPGALFHHPLPEEEQEDLKGSKGSNLLVSSLDGAVPLVQVDDVAKFVAWRDGEGKHRSEESGTRD